MFKNLKQRFGKKELDSTSPDIPALPKETIEYLDTHDAHLTEGIFRIPGLNENILTIVKLYSKGKSVNLSEYSIHDVGGALKKWLISMKDPVLTLDLYDAWIAAAMLPVDLRPAAFKRLINSIPIGNKNLLTKLMTFLKKITEHSNVNKMTASNLSIIFSQSLILSPNPDPIAALNDNAKCNAVIEYLIANFNNENRLMVLAPLVACEISDIPEKQEPKPLGETSTKEEEEFIVALKKGTLRLAKTLISEQQYRNSVRFRGTVLRSKETQNSSADPHRRPSIFDSLVKEPPKRSEASQQEPANEEEIVEDANKDEEDSDDSYDESEEFEDEEEDTGPDGEPRLRKMGAALDEFFDIEDILRHEREEKMKKKGQHSVEITEEERRAILAKMSKQLEPDVLSKAPSSPSLIRLKDSRPDFSPGGTPKKKGRFRSKIHKNPQSTPPLSPFPSDMMISIPSASPSSPARHEPQTEEETTTAVQTPLPAVAKISSPRISPLLRALSSSSSISAESSNPEFVVVQPIDLEELADSISAADIVVGILNGDTDNVMRFMNQLNMTRCLELESQLETVEKQLEDVQFGVNDDLINDDGLFSEDDGENEDYDGDTDDEDEDEEEGEKKDDQVV